VDTNIILNLALLNPLRECIGKELNVMTTPTALGEAERLDDTVEWDNSKIVGQLPAHRGVLLYQEFYQTYLEGHEYIDQQTTNSETYPPWKEWKTTRKFTHDLNDFVVRALLHLR
jgi:hypothetical protein